MNIAEVPEILEALSKLAWPILTGVVVWKFYPGLRRIIESRGFKVKIGEMEVTVQQANDQLRNQLEDLQRALSGKNRPSEMRVAAMSPPSPPSVQRILWVDDNPSNNAFEIARLESEGYGVYQAKSTPEALGMLKGGDLSIDVVISDMGRNEDGKYNPDAGLNFIEQARAADIMTPIYVYTTAKHAARTREQVLKAGGTGITKSALELFEMLQHMPNG